MSTLKDDSITTYEAMTHIQNGKYVMPAFQRQFVWSMEQIEKLWDSILLDYPIATFLFWHVMIITLPGIPTSAISSRRSRSITASKRTASIMS